MDKVLGHGKFKVTIDASHLDKVAKARVNKALTGMEKRVEQASRRMGDRFKNLGKAAAVGAAAAGVGVIALGKGLLDAGEAASTANARTEQIAKSMGLFGDQTGQVTERLKNLAESTARQTGVDTNSIKLTQAKLLTFKELAATADDTGGAFDRATQAAVDMASAGLGSAETNAVQLGKALNDPIKGVSALSRVGVTFTDAEKAKIKTMVESGNIHKAQDLILKSLEKQTGGTAKATANASDRIKVSLSQTAEKVGTWLLPTFEKTADWVQRDGVPAMESFGRYAKDAFNGAKPAMDTFGRIIKDNVVPFVKDATSHFMDLVRWIDDNRGWLEPITGAVVVMTATWKAYTLVAAAVKAITTGIMVVQTLWTAKTTIMTVAQTALNTALRANPIGLVITLIAGIAAGLVIAYKRSETFRNIVNVLWKVTKQAFTDAAHKVMEFGRATIDAYHTYVEPMVNKVKSGFSSIKDATVALKTGVVQGFVRMFNALRKPVNWFISNIINKGIIANYNKVAKLFGAPKVDPLGTIGALSTGSSKRSGRSTGFQAYREGGTVRGRGTGLSDSVPSLLGHDEFVVRAKESRRHRRLLHAINDGTFSDMVRRNADLSTLVPKFAAGGVANALRWARAQAGKPYIWAGVGPRGYDCSGAVSALINVLRGQYAHRRLFATGSLPSWFRPGRGMLTVGVDKPGEKHRIGHTAARLAGVNVESRGSRGFLVGNAARSPMSFNHQYTIGGYNTGGGSGGSGWGLPSPKDLLKGVLNGLGNNAFTNLLKSAANKLAGYAVDKIENLGLFDNGGLASGRGLLTKLTNKPERVLSPRQTESFERLTATLGTTGGKVIHATFNIYETSDGRSTAKAVVDELGKMGAVA